MSDVTKSVGSRIEFILASKRFSNLTILALFVVIFSLFSLLSRSGTFLSLDNIEGIALAASELLILGSGSTFLLIAGGLDLSVGAVIVFTSIAMATITSKLTEGLAGVERTGFALWGPVILGALVGIVIGLAWGVFNGVIVVRTGIPPFIATLAASTVILGLAQVWTGGINVSGAPSELQETFGLGKMFNVIPWPVVLAIVIVAILWIVLAKTRFGLRVYAIGANPEAARRAGIDVGKYTVVLYGLVGLLAGIVGVVEVARFTTATVSGYSSIALNVITAVVIGGTSLWGGRGNMGGTVVGSLIPATLTSGFVILGLLPFWQNVAVGAVLLIAVSVDQFRRQRLNPG